MRLFGSLPEIESVAGGNAGGRKLESWEVGSWICPDVDEMFYRDAHVPTTVKSFERKFFEGNFWKI